MITATRAQRRQLARENYKQPVFLKEVPKSEWPINHDKKMLRVFRSRDFLVQELLEESPAIVRLSVCRTELSGGRWEDGITWDDLQRIKRECGYQDHDAIEIYPADKDIVNVAKMRHLWLMDEKISFAWRKQ